MREACHVIAHVSKAIILPPPPETTSAAQQPISVLAPCLRRCSSRAMSARSVSVAQDRSAKPPTQLVSGSIRSCDHREKILQIQDAMETCFLFVPPLHPPIFNETCVHQFGNSTIFHNDVECIPKGQRSTHNLCTPSYTKL